MSQSSSGRRIMGAPDFALKFKELIGQNDTSQPGKKKMAKGKPTGGKRKRKSEMLG